METLQLKTKFSNDIVCEIQKDDEGKIYLAMSGGPLQAPLSLPATLSDVVKLQSLLTLAVQVYRVTA